jgi:hypothetical protein
MWWWWWWAKPFPYPKSEDCDIGAEDTISQPNQTEILHEKLYESILGN